MRLFKSLPVRSIQSHRALISAVLAGLFLLGLGALAQASADSDAPVVQDAYARAVPPGMSNSAVFMRIHNPSEEAITLVGATSPVAEVVELHTHEQDAGVMKMRRVERIEIPPQDEAVLEPGGLHLMLINLRQPLAAGDPVALELEFADGRTVTLTAETRAVMPALDAPN